MINLVNHISSVKGTVNCGLFTRLDMVAGWPEQSNHPVQSALYKRPVAGATSEEVSRG